MFSGLSLEVIDPLNRTGKISIPMKYVSETRGVVDFRKTPAKREGKDLSLCLLFQKGKCKAGDRCHQVHADAEYVDELRHHAAAGNNCCAHHGDFHSAGYLTFGISVVKVMEPSGDVRRYNLSSFGRTQCLDTILRNSRNGDARVPATKICRLHGQGRCKFGRDCKNVHLCPKADELHEVTPQKELAVGVAPLDFSCGLSDRASNMSKTSSPHDSPLELSLARVKGPLSCDDSFSFFSQPLGWSAVQASPAFDASGFEETLRSLREEFADLLDARTPRGH